MSLITQLSEENRRPEIPNNHPWTKELANIIGLCWRLQPASRPEFPKAVNALEAIGRKYNVCLWHVSMDLEKTPRMTERPLISPDIRPCPSLPRIPSCEHRFYLFYAIDPHTPPVEREHDQESETSSSYKTIYSHPSKPQTRPSTDSSHEGDPGSPSVGTSSSFLSSIDGEDFTHIRMDSPPPLGEVLSHIKDERRYRMLLQHEFHPSCAFLFLTLIRRRQSNRPTSVQ